MKKKTILIAESDKDVARYYCSILQGKYEVILACSGQHAMRIVRRSDAIDLVLLEHRLPDISGLDVLRDIKKHRPAVPVVFVTAYGNEDVAVQGFRYGARDYLKKPCAYEDLMARIEFCLSLERADKKRRTVACPMDTPLASAPSLRDIASHHHLSIQRAVKFIEDNFMSKICLAKAAEKACMSRYHFSRAFKNETSVPYQKYVTGLRVQKARELLQDPRRTITEIAHVVGYGDSSNFIRNFRKLTGCTPSEFRSNPRLSRSGRNVPD